MPALMNSSIVPRQLIIGVDAMEWDLVTKWADAGKLPTLRRLLEEGTQANLSTVADRFPDTSWQCLCSGLSPAHLKRYFYVQEDLATGGMRYLADDRWGAKFFWDLMSEAGRRVGVVDIPHTVAKAAIPHGFQLSWGTHGLHGARFSNPPSMLREVEQRFGRHPAGECDMANSDRQRKALLPRLIDGVKMHGELFRDCIMRREWDLMIGVFAAPHCAGHIYWHDMDTTHPQHDPTDPYQLAGAIEDVYRAIDREIGTMIEAAGPGVRVYIVSPLGMGPLYHASWNLPDLLERWGYGPDSKLNHRNSVEGRASTNLWRIMRMVIPGKLQYAAFAALPHRLQEELLFRFYCGNRSWDGWRAFAVPNNDATGAIRINLKGRDHEGMVEPGRDYERACDDICTALAELTDPVTGKAVAGYICRTQRELRGPYVDELPDITVQWNASFPWSSVNSPRFGTLELPIQDSRKGSHTEHGFLIAAGEGIARGAKIAQASIYDFMPTIMNTARVPIPAACEGRPLFTNQDHLR